MSRTLAPAPTDRSMWRRLLRRCHPDAGGEHDLFIWVRELREHVTGVRGEAGRRTSEAEAAHPANASSSEARERIDYAAAFDRAGGFGEFTEQIAAWADSGDVAERYASLLRLVRDCYEAHAGPLHRQQHQGSTYRTLAAIAHAAGMSKRERVGWYKLCETIPMSQRHAGHIMSKIKREAA